MQFSSFNGRGGQAASCTQRPSRRWMGWHPCRKELDKGLVCACALVWHFHASNGVGFVRCWSDGRRTGYSSVQDTTSYTGPGTSRACTYEGKHPGEIYTVYVRNTGTEYPVLDATVKGKLSTWILQGWRSSAAGGQSFTYPQVLLREKWYWRCFKL